MTAASLRVPWAVLLEEIRHVRVTGDPADASARSPAAGGVITVFGVSAPETGTVCAAAEMAGHDAP